MAQPRMQVSATVLGGPDPRQLGEFYARLLEWTVVKNDPTWVMIKPPNGGTGLSFQLESEYAAHRDRSSPSRWASNRTASAFASPCSTSPTRWPV